jgi:hypothetical protein
MLIRGGDVQEAMEKYHAPEMGLMESVPQILIASQSRIQTE